MYLHAFGLLFLLGCPSLLVGHEPAHCKSHTVSCVCGIGENKKYVTIELKMAAVQDSVTGKLKCDGNLDPYQACANISCIFASNASNASVKRKSMFSFFFAEELTIPAGGFPKGHRSKRQAGSCDIPTLKNAAIKCWKWPNWMNCDINCIHGYAFQDTKATVTTKNVNCRNGENVWKPHAFKDCQPFLNCNALLVKPGNMKCHEPIDGPAYCDISCLDYGEDQAVALQKYQCVDENFGRNLPHCAVLKKDVSLVPRPK